MKRAKRLILTYLHTYLHTYLLTTLVIESAKLIKKQFGIPVQCTYIIKLPNFTVFRKYRYTGFNALCF